MNNKLYKITPVIMVGGSGDRLWPLSEKVSQNSLINYYLAKVISRNN